MVPLHKCILPFRRPYSTCCSLPSPRPSFSSTSLFSPHIPLSLSRLGKFSCQLGKYLASALPRVITPIDFTLFRIRRHLELLIKLLSALTRPASPQFPPCRFSSTKKLSRRIERLMPFSDLRDSLGEAYSSCFVSLRLVRGKFLRQEWYPLRSSSSAKNRNVNILETIKLTCELLRFHSSSLCTAVTSVFQINHVITHNSIISLYYFVDK